MPKPKVYNKRRASEIPKDAIYIGRPSPWGNPFSKGTREQNVADFKEYAEKRCSKDPQWLAPLKNKNVICWCAPKKCHGDVLIKMANQTESEIDWDEWADQNCPEDVILDQPSLWEIQNIL